MASKPRNPPNTDAVSVHACAKINLTLRVTGRRADGYHGLRTVFQSLAVHDTLAFLRTRGPFRIECDDPGCPTDSTNLVWRAAEMVWRAAGRRGEPRNVTVRIAKRIPLQSGMGGGSSDAAAAVRGLTHLWRLALPRDTTRRIAGRVGADVPFFLEGGTVLGLERGDLLFPLVDLAPAWVTLVIPPFGVITKEAFGWLDTDGLPDGHEVGNHHQSRSIDHREPQGDDVVPPSRARAPKVAGSSYGDWPPGEYRNDLEAPVAARHPDIGRIVRALRRQGADYAAMSGSGSAVFGIFASRTLAARAAGALATARRRTVVTRVVGRAEYAALSAPRSASV